MARGGETGHGVGGWLGGGGQRTHEAAGEAHVCKSD